jgi:hypothetical protein
MVMEETALLAEAAKCAIEAEDTLCEKIRTSLNTAFGSKVVIGVRLKKGRDCINFDITGCWSLPRNS